MKQVKKALMILVMVTLIITMFGPLSVSAAEFNATEIKNSDNKTATSLVKLMISDEFTVTIPTDIVLTKVFTNEVENEYTYRTHPSSLPKVEVEVSVIDKDKRINITVTSVNYSILSNNWTMTGVETNAPVPYYLKAGVDHINDSDYENEGNKAQYLLQDGESVVLTNESIVTPIHALVAEIPKNTDNFIDHLTFTISYEDNPDVATSP